jgi:hypothetical protein
MEYSGYIVSDSDFLLSQGIPILDDRLTAMANGLRVEWSLKWASQRHPPELGD